MELEPNTRLFLVVGKNAEADMLTEAFRQFGTIQSVKMVKEKGVAYIKYEKASSAAAAIESMHETVLNDGRGPMVKVMFAEAPKAGAAKRSGNGRSGSGDLKVPLDPDNVPPLSRLFIVVPKTANGAAIEAEMAAFQDLQYCKTDLIASKGILFCKYSKSSSALRALENVQETGMLAGYKVKCMLAEPKGKRSRNEASDYSDPVSPVYQAASLAFDRGTFTGSSFPGSSLSTGSYLSNAACPQSPSHSALSGGSEARAPSLNSAWAPPYTQGISRRAAAEMNAARLSPGGNALPAGFAHNGLSGPAYTGAELGNVGGALGIEGLSHLAGLQAIAAIQGAANLASTGSLSGVDLLAIGKQVGMGGFGGLGNLSPHALGGLRMTPLQSVDSNPTAPSTPAGPVHSRALPPDDSPSGEAGPPTRLYVVVHKGATEEMLTALFRVFPGMELCDLKRDHTKGLSRGFAYVSYRLAETAALAVEHLNGIEFPPNSGHRMKVMFADPQVAQRKLVHTSSALSDSNDALLRRPTEGEEEEPESSHRMGSQDSISDSLDHKVEVAAVQNSLSHLSMPQRAEEPRGPVAPSGEGTPQSLPLLKPRRHFQHSPSGSDKEGEAESKAKTDAMLSPDAQSRTVYTVLARPLPHYAIQHYFARCGPVELVHLQPQDERYGAVQFCKAESARAALELLNGSDICGEALNVLPADPLLAARNKRARVSV